jgi:hypothetical protein
MAVAKAKTPKFSGAESTGVITERIRPCRGGVEGKVVVGSAEVASLLKHPAHCRTM